MKEIALVFIIVLFCDLVILLYSNFHLTVKRGRQTIGLDFSLHYKMVSLI